MTHKTGKINHSYEHYVTLFDMEIDSHIVITFDYSLTYFIKITYRFCHYCICLQNSFIIY